MITTIAEFDSLDILKNFTNDKFNSLDRFHDLANYRRRIMDFQYKGAVYQIRSSASYDLMLENAVCVDCGVVANLVRLEYQSDCNPFRPHFRIYHKSLAGNVILMTRDHIIPKSCGGPNKPWNFQTMCSTCNNKKSNTLVSDVFGTLSMQQLNEISVSVKKKLNNLFVDPSTNRSLHNLLLINYIVDPKFRSAVQNFDPIYNQFLVSTGAKQNKSFFKNHLHTSVKQMVNILRCVSL